MFDYITVLIVMLWLFIASIIDIKTKEVPNWLNFSLIAIGIGIYIFKSVLISSFTPILYSLIGLSIFFVLGTLMYYSKQWGGGDAKLLYGLGAILPLYPESLKTIFNPSLNLPFLAIFFLNLVIVGSIYGLFISVFIIIKERKKFTENFKIILSKTKVASYLIIMASSLLIISSFILSLNDLAHLFIILVAIAPLIFFYILISVKAIENIAMLKKIKTNNLVEGDWILEKIKIGNKIIYDPKRSYGVTKKQIAIIKKYKKEVLVKEGVAFVPPFLVAMIISLIYGNILF